MKLSFSASGIKKSS